MKYFALCAALVALPSIATAQDEQKTQQVGAMPAPTLPLKHAPMPTKPAISVEDLMTRLYIFADDSMMGREAGTLGSVKATEYLAAEAKRIGLEPGGDNGTYFQNLPLKVRSIDPMSSFIAGGANLTLGTDWAIGGQSSITGEALPVVYGGMFGDEEHKITPEQAAGKLVVMSVPMTNEAINAVALSDEPLVPATAAGVIVLIPAAAQKPVFNYVGQSGVTVVDGALAPTRLFVGAGALGLLFTKSMTDLQIGDAGVTVALNAIVNMNDNEFPARNVIGILPGSDKTLKNQYVAIGAHSDHVGFAPHAVDHDSLLVFNRMVRPGGAEDGMKAGTPDQYVAINAELAELRKTSPMRADSIFNGADDDGSGSVAVLEIAEQMAAMKTKPKRSTLFVWHVGEEKGLWGSAYFTAHSTAPRDSIVAQLNMDMVGRGSARDQTGMSIDGQELHGGANYLQLVGSRRVSTELGNTVERVNADKKYGFSFDYSMDANGHPMNIYCRSDHYEYAKFGIPVTFFTTGGHSAYHQLTDEPQYIDYPHMMRVAQLVSDIAIDVGNAPTRPVVDQPKLDPRKSCQQ